MKKISILLLLSAGLALTGCNKAKDDVGSTDMKDVNINDIKEKGEKKTVDGKEVIEYKTEDGGVIQMDPEALEDPNTSFSIGQWW